MRRSSALLVVIMSFITTTNSSVSSHTFENKLETFEPIEAEPIDKPHIDSIDKLNIELHNEIMTYKALVAKIDSLEQLNNK